MEDWKCKLLSKAGRATLLKSVIQAMYLYQMSSLKFASKICKDIDKASKFFWWKGKVDEGNFLCLNSWLFLCQPKVYGGLGFRRMEDITKLS